MTSALRSPGAEPSGDRAASSFRPDIEGLRAVAIGLVLLYHAGLPWVPGGYVGVDVFFVISGFLITGLLVREVERSGRVSLVRFYARRARRLLPAAGVVLLAAAAVTWVLLPLTQRRVFGGDIAAAALYAVNWRLADRSVDYLAEGIGASPVQHFWSLAVEEQFYIVWPLLLLAAAALVRRFGWPLRPTMACALAAVSVPSFAWSMAATADDPRSAFFLTTTRLWELGVGAAVAVGLGLWSRLPAAAAGLLGAAGLAVVAASGLLLDDTAEWPGHLALLPVLGTAAVIVAGSSGHVTVAGRLLGVRPMVWIGALSYSLYLWHWVMIVAAEGAADSLRTVERAAVVAASFVPAYLSYRLLENPVRHLPRLVRSPRLTLSLGAGVSLVGLVAGLVLVSPSASRRNPPPPEAIGAAAVTADPASATRLWSVDLAQSITPRPQDATQDVPPADDEGCVAPSTRRDGDKVLECVYGDADSAVTVALVGDSKALQWSSALADIAADRGWRLVVLSKSACPFVDGLIPRTGKPFTRCGHWNEAAVERLRELRPAVVLTSQVSDASIVDPRAGGIRTSRDAMVRDLASRWRTLVADGLPVVVLTNNAKPKTEAYECVARNLRRLSVCSFVPDLATATVQRRAATLVPGVGVVDLNPLICPGGRCPAVIGNVLVYRQGSHLTRTFVDTLRPALEDALDVALRSVVPTPVPALLR